MNWGIYLQQAARCRAEAVSVRDAKLQSLLQEECSLWLMLARESQAVEDTVRQVTATLGDLGA